MKKFLFIILTLLPFLSYSHEIEIIGFLNNVNVNDEDSKVKNKIFYYRGIIETDGSLNKYQLKNTTNKESATGVKGLELSYSIIQNDTGVFSLKVVYLLSYYNILEPNLKQEGEMNVLENESLDLGKFYHSDFKKGNIKLYYRVVNNESDNTILKQIKED